MLPCAAPVSAGPLLLLLVVFVLASASGTALLARALPRALARPGGDPEASAAAHDRARDAALALGPLAGLVVAALPGWVLSTAFRVGLATVVLPLAAIAVA